MKAMRTSMMLLLVLTLIGLAATPAHAGREDDANRKSKNGMTEGTIDGVSVALEYGRPKVKDRTIWGKLVAYGKVWRTGADEATTVTFGGDVTVEGEKLPAGTYSLFTIPGEKGWTFIFNKVAEQWGAYDYESGKDALRVNVTPKSHANTEEMDFVIEGSSVVLRWADVAVGFEVAAN